jgi:hypothetical protein
MATYFKTRFLNDPVVYVQGEGFWRSYGPQGTKQVEGSIPEKLFAGLEQISRAEAERYISWRSSQGNGGAEPVKNVPAKRRPRAHRTVYAVVGIVLVIAIAVGAGVVFGGWGRGAPGSGTGQTGSQNSASAKEVVAKVGGRSITRAELEARTADFETQYSGKVPDKATDPENYKVFQIDVLDYMITYELAARKAKELGLTVTDADVQAEMDSILSDAYGGDQAKFDAALAQQGITLKQLQSSYKESTLLQKVHDAVTANVTWQAWIAQQKQAAGVTYGAGWEPTPATEATAP